MAIAVKVSNLRKSFLENDERELTAIDNVSFDVEQNEFVCILGPSGCGKSTILNILSGLEIASGGEVHLAGNEQLSRGSIGYVFQEPRLLPWKNIFDNIRFVLRQMPLSENEESDRIREALKQVGLEDFAAAYPHQLSGGMQARVGIARALATEPDLLLMDEPFGGLDEITGRSMRKLLLQLWEHKRKTILFVTHNLFEAVFLADRLILMSARPGRIYKIVKNGLGRPRDYEDPAVFAASANLAREFLSNLEAAK